MTACDLCEAEHQGDAYLCHGCTQATERRLDRMHNWYVLLAAELAPGSGSASTGSRSKSAEVPLPIHPHVADIRSTMRATLEGWRAAMQADRGWGPPAVGESGEERVRAAARGLRLNMDWIAAEWDAAGAFAGEIRELEWSARTIVGPSERTIRLGLCPAPAEDGACGAVLRVKPGAKEVRCAWCGTVWPESRWVALAAAQQAVTESEAAPAGAEALPHA